MAKVIVRWTAAETHSAMLFATLLPGESAAAHDIYHDFFDQSQRKRVFLAVAKPKLSTKLIQKAEQFFNDARRVAEDRNIVAHSLWCYSTSAPECLCTINPKAITLEFISRMEKVFANPGEPFSLDEEYGVGERLTSYRAKDFEDMLGRIETHDRKSLALANAVTAHLFPHAHGVMS